ncbi:MAG: glycosyl transferase family 9 [Bacteroidetes bacterium]|nr:glycosyl transferase family 9 [Bacteroidota bacterium]
MNLDTDLRRFELSVQQHKALAFLLQRALIGSLRFLASQRGTENLQPSHIRTLLVVELTRLGDVMAMLSSLARFKTFFTNARILVLVDSRFLSLLDSLETGFEFIGISNPQTPTGLIRALRFVRKKPVDLAISMSSPRRNALVVLASNSRFKLGYLTYVDSVTPFLLSTPVQAFGFVLPANLRYAKENIYRRPALICEALGMNENGMLSRIDFKPDRYALVRARLEREGLIPNRDYVLLHAFSGWKFRSWDLSQFVALAGKIHDKLEHDIVMCCEEKDLEKLSSTIPPASPIRVVASSDLLDVAVLMKEAALFIGNDSGPLHLAAALNVRTVGLFGPAPPELTAPESNRGTNLYKRVECSPCDQRKCVRPENPCMGLHEVEDVFAAVATALGSRLHDKSLRADA